MFWWQEWAIAAAHEAWEEALTLVTMRHSPSSLRNTMENFDAVMRRSRQLDRILQASTVRDFFVRFKCSVSFRFDLFRFVPFVFAFSCLVTVRKGCFSIVFACFSAVNANSLFCFHSDHYIRVLKSIGADFDRYTLR